MLQKKTETGTSKRTLKHKVHDLKKHILK